MQVPLVPHSSLCWKFQTDKMRYVHERMKKKINIQLLYFQHTLTSVWDISWSHDTSNLFHALKIWTQSTMATEDFFINDGRNRQTVEAISEGFP
jgi:hypothetical protein